MSFKIFQKSRGRPISKRISCVKIARKILVDLKYYEWNIKIIDSGGGLCVHEVKEIWVDESHLNELPWFLHEIAHIKYPDHSPHWADWYTKLLSFYCVPKDRFMYVRNPTEVSHEQGTM